MSFEHTKSGLWITCDCCSWKEYGNSECDISTSVPQWQVKCDLELRARWLYLVLKSEDLTPMDQSISARSDVERGRLTWEQSGFGKAQEESRTVNMSDIWTKVLLSPYANNEGYEFTRDMSVMTRPINCQEYAHCPSLHTYPKLPWWMELSNGVRCTLYVCQSRVVNLLQMEGRTSFKAIFLRAWSVTIAVDTGKYMIYDGTSAKE